jgi:chaperonin GroEL
MSKLIEIKDTRSVILKPVKEMEEIVCSTMGPHGQNVMLRNEADSPVITKDGVTVAKSVNSDDAFEQLIFDILKQAAERTNSEAGDGTTTATSIAANTFKEGFKLISADVDPMSIKREIDLFLETYKDELKKHRVIFKDNSDKEIQDTLYKIAMISTNGDIEMSKVISEATARAGLSGIINIKQATGDYGITQSKGVKIPNAGVVNYDFVKGTVDKKVTLKNVYVLLTTYELENPSLLTDLKPTFEHIGKNGSLLIISKKVDKGFLAHLLQWNATGQLKNAAVRAPYFGAVGREMMDDLAAYLGTVVIEEDKKHSFAKLEANMLGRVEEADVTPHYTILRGVNPDKVRLAQRIKLLEDKLETIKDKQSDPDKTLERLSLLNGKVFTISVPSISEIEDKERMDRIDDAINACKGALKYGYIPGGGITLARIGRDSKSSLIQKILTSPLSKILSNAGKSEHQAICLLEDEQDVSTSYDLRNGIEGDALEIGVIDPYKVAECAVINGLSVGSMLLTTKAIILPKQTKETAFDMSY